MKNAPSPPTTNPPWARWVLLLAAGYNLAIGAWIILFPHAWFDLAGVPRMNYPQIWQCVGMIVGVYGIAYALAARDPLGSWPIVLVGLLGKVLGPIGFLDALRQGIFPLRMGWIILTNDLIWWIPFAALLLLARRQFLRSSVLAEA